MILNAIGNATYRTLAAISLCAASAAIISPSSSALHAGPPARPELVDVYVSGSEGYHTYRIPALVVTNQGTLLAFCEGRKDNRRDHGDIDLLLRRSADGGRTWLPIQIVHEEGDTASITIGNPCPVVDRRTGTVWLSFCRDNDRVFITHSGDDGATWAPPVEITPQVKHENWDWYATGPGHGIQLARGPNRGRLLMPCDHRQRGAESWKTNGRSHVIYSDDGGTSWQLGGITEPGMNECEAVQRCDGSLLLSMRNYLGSGRRAFATSDDGGLTWSKPILHRRVPCPVCQASVVGYSHGDARGRDRLLYSGPGRSDARRELTVRLSDDGGKTWPVANIVYDGPSAYSDMAVTPEGTILCLFERGEEHSYERITLARMSIEWLTQGREPPVRNP